MFSFFKKKFSIYAETQAWLTTQQLVHASWPEVTSTNDLAKTEALTVGESLKVYLTDHQTLGRGRHTRSWISPSRGDALMCTWSYHLQESPKALTAPMIGLALYEALMRAFPSVPFSIKAPNDIYVGDRKLLGILTETVSAGSQSRLIIGIGMNVFSHPRNVPTAAHLSETAKVTPATWRRFLDHLRWELDENARACLGTHLTEPQRARLLTALNRHPLLEETYLSVSPFGDLTTSSQTKSWRDL